MKDYHLVKQNSEVSSQSKPLPLFHGWRTLLRSGDKMSREPSQQISAMSATAVYLTGVMSTYLSLNICSCSFSVFLKAADLIVVYDDRPRHKEARFTVYKQFRDRIVYFSVS
jgi:hypothetical protein